ncbi:MAG: right-handed parallel beta-helix repeat-containing protein [Bacteroidales bacterium]|nr:right-handed parallel beta-helix repeat-containing protein [Bacteroidales bacterium]
MLAILISMYAAASAMAQAVNIDVEPGAYTIEEALQKARIMRLHGDGDKFTLHLKAGEYRLNAPIVIRPEDSGVTIVGDGKAVVSGGVRIENWHKQGKVWWASVPRFNGRPLLFRQMWVDGKKADRARDVQNFDDMYRILSLNKQKEEIYVPAKAVKSIVGADGVEMVIHQMWCTANLRIKNIKMLGDSAALTFHQPESHIEFRQPWPQPMVTSDGRNSSFYLTNAKALLDEKGEWWLDEKAERVYYIPRDGENMNSADVEVPAVETLVQVLGTIDNPVRDVTIEGVSFSYATWLRPSFYGHNPLQAGMYMTEAYKIRPQISRPNGDHKLDNHGWVGRPAAAVVVNHAQNIRMQNCVVTHCASTGIDFNENVVNGEVSRSLVEDCGGTGILIGTFGPAGHEAHQPYDPTDRRIACVGCIVRNNIITNVTNEDWGTVGIGAGYVRSIRICNNEISEVSYTGISMGWGWNQQIGVMGDNRIEHNLIHHYAKHMYDVAGIYTLGSQPHSFIQENTVRDIYAPPYAHDPNHWFYLYTDEGSSGITMRNNWTPAEKFLQNSNGPTNTWENNGPMVADSIKALAGVEN